MLLLSRVFLKTQQISGITMELMLYTRESKYRRLDQICLGMYNSQPMDRQMKHSKTCQFNIKICLLETRQGLNSIQIQIKNGQF